MTFDAPFNRLPCFNILEIWRRRKVMINLEIVKFLKKLSKRLLNNREICRRGPNFIQKRKGSIRTETN